MKILQNRTICMVTISTNGTSCNMIKEDFHFSLQNS